MTSISRREALQIGTAQVLAHTLPPRLMLLGGSMALRVGAAALVPVGLFTAKEARAEPFTLAMLFIFGIIAGAAVESSRVKALNDKRSWQARVPSRFDDFHDTNSANAIVKPEFRFQETLPSGITIDTLTNDGRLALTAPPNAAGMARKDLNEDEMAIMSKFGAVLPRTERIAPENLDGSIDLQRDAWRKMFGVRAEINPSSYKRAFSDISGNTFVASRHVDPGNGQRLVFVHRLANEDKVNVRDGDLFRVL